MGTRDRNARHLPGARLQTAANRGTIRNRAATGMVSSGRHALADAHRLGPGKARLRPCTPR
jgi:hypothetical protein